MTKIFLSQDRYATVEGLPPVDNQQDWIVDAGEEENGYTVLAFRRNWVTCDIEQDRDIRVRFRYTNTLRKV